jgi:hypothetical protein
MKRSLLGRTMAYWQQPSAFAGASALYNANEQPMFFCGWSYRSRLPSRELRGSSKHTLIHPKRLRKIPSAAIKGTSRTQNGRSISATESDLHL